jgi:diacylglycerol kinase (ATP)
VVVGGDGSCLCVAEKLHKIGLPLGVIPLGTANNLARSLSIPLSSEEAVQIIGQGHTHKIDLGMVNGKPFLNVTGMGLSTQVNRSVPAELKRRWGVFAYAIYLVKVANRTRPFRAEITCDGKTRYLSSLQITVCNGRHYGTGLTIREDATIDDHCLDLLSLNPRTWWEGIRLLPKLIKGRYTPDSAARILRGKKISVRTYPILSVDTDGEITTKTPLEFEIIPNALSVFSPVPAQIQSIPKEEPKPIPDLSLPEHHSDNEHPDRPETLQSTG